MYVDEVVTKPSTDTTRDRRSYASVMAEDSGLNEEAVKEHFRALRRQNLSGWLCDWLDRWD